MTPFLLLASRAGDTVADEEYAAFLRFGCLEPHELVRVRMEQESFAHVSPSAYSGIVLGGSPFTVSEPAVTKSETQLRVESELSTFLDEIVATDLPFLGACYGIGTLGLHQGAVVDATYSEPVGAVTVDLTPEGRLDPLLQVLPPSFEAFVGHKEAVTTLPEHAVRLAGSAGCPVQAFRVGQRVYATQFHPELDVPGICSRIDAYRHYGYFPPEEADSLKATAAASAVVHPPALVRRFVELFARD